MADENQREFWQRGQVENIPGLLQPVAHALLQARQEVGEMMTGFPPALLWEKPAGVASPAFHLQHLTGVLDRLFTYARGESLREEQFNYLRLEGMPADVSPVTLVDTFYLQVDKALEKLGNTDARLLEEPRLVGRAQIPSNVLGLLFHAAEHTMRHVGQLSVTVRVLKSAS
ncbi:DinB family protein [Segetibacter sp. 3557_3]|uniref:DinB family protein n=1 Tax=Segetibacter sp. 3557_3 TaxID=2547429 RepID=UPI001058A05A|nr:DinB family protein [Segetibacter sp. 3557_3]TDH28771.1 DinB family protein [Segetibacter sp. 3557_3]